jgi:hypothetical protein
MGTAASPAPSAQRPGGRTPNGPVPAQVLGRLGQVVGHYPGMGGLPGPAHGHVGQLAPPAVGEKVSTSRLKVTGVP